MEKSRTVRQRKNDPNLYLFVKGEWYAYNPYEQPLGSGAMGDVYRGYNCRTGTMVAIKKVKDMFANNPKIRSRARLEANLAFIHPNLVEMIGSCEYAPDYGPIYILSNYVHGEDIDKYVKRLDGFANRVNIICEMICCVLDALDYIHSQGIVHRDIKPSNIMIENNQNVRLMDLGVARTSGGNKFSSFGFIGTPEYSAPEQMKTEENTTEINATTDIYAIGLTLYELLAGHNPMKCATDAETLSKQMKATLPSDAAIPKRLMKVILKATEKQQAERYLSARAMKQAIIEANTPEPGLGEKIGNWIRQISSGF